jgi:hypothetical protein
MIDTIKMQAASAGASKKTPRTAKVGRSRLLPISAALAALLVAVLVSPHLGHAQVAQDISAAPVAVATALGNASDMRAAVLVLPPFPNPFPSEAAVGP